MNVNVVLTNIASGYVGYREIGENEAFEHPVFQKLLYDRGWRPGLAWCSFFCELVYYEVYDKEVDPLFSASAVQTFYNFKKAGWDVTDNPVRGGLAVWQLYKNGKKQWQGHIAVIESSLRDTITTIDGNSNNIGSRLGFMVARVTRVINREQNNGLRLLGFIKPKEI